MYSLPFSYKDVYSANAEYLKQQSATFKFLFGSSGFCLVLIRVLLCLTVQRLFKLCYNSKLCQSLPIYMEERPSRLVLTKLNMDF
ncbi:unnamed protein product [Heterobilharzia americana]|nr:unnamed protein product [Heterobilharzia americana]